jgi:hypothetical protein
MRSLALITLLVTSCATDVDRAAGEIGTTYLVCGSSVRLDISHDGRTAVVREAGGQEAILQRVESTMGTRYAGAGVAILRSGETYIYTDPEGHTVSCDRLPR